MKARESMRRWWLLCLMVLAWGGVAMAQTGNFAKIDPELQELMHQSRDANETFRVIIEMTEQYDNTNLERGTALMSRVQRRDYVVNELKRFSEQSQRGMVRFLNVQSTRGGVTQLHRFWIFNGICCEATAACIGELSVREDVRYVSLDEEMQMIDPIEEEGGTRDNNPPEGVQWHVSKVRANEVWTYNGSTGYTGNGVVVAIIDSGVNYEHEDIRGNMWDGDSTLYPHHGWDFYDNDNDPKDENAESGHGSHVAGIVASHGLTYQAGIAPGASIMALKVGGASNNDLGSMYMICQAIEFALEHGADIINLSLGGQNGQGGNSYYRNTFVNVLNAGVVATVAAGNEGFILDFDNYHAAPYNISSPGNCPPPWLNPDQYNILPGGTSAVICVGNVNQNDKRYITSSFGPVTWAEGANIGSYNDYPYEQGSNTNIGLIRPDVSAPGTNIWSIRCSVNEGYHKLNGTSMSAPCVAGVIALMLEANPNLTPEQIDKILEITAQPCDNQLAKNNEYGAGRVDAYRAVTAARNMINTPQTYHISVAKYPFTDSNCISVSGTGDYEPNSSCTIKASPADYFIRWEKDGVTVGTDATYTFTVTANAHYKAIFEEDVPDGCYYINVTGNPTGAAGGGSGWGYYFSGSSCTLSAFPTSDYEFYNWTKDDEVVSWNAEFTFTVSENALYVANFRRWNSVTATSAPTYGGTIEGQGSYLTGDTCTLTAVPNLGYAFAGWYNGTFLVSMSPSYSFTVNGDRTMTAMFAPASYTITTSALPPVGGSVSGGGTYPAGSVVTVSASANPGYRFNGWVEDGQLVARSNSYMFAASTDRSLTATFVSTQSGIGSVVTNADGSKGVLFHIEPSGVGWMVALDDTSDGCPWGPTTNIQILPDQPCEPTVILKDLSGFMNTGLIRTELGTDNNYAASQVDFDHGWYLPSAGQLRKLYAALPFVDSVLYYNGGSALSEDTYWSSTEYSSSYAVSPSFAMNNSNKGISRRVRAIRNYFSPQDNMIIAVPENTNQGSVTIVNNGIYSYGANAAVMAHHKAGYVFDHWSEEGLPVSNDNPYMFTFTHSRRLVAHFVVDGGDVGTIVHNLDGSDGVVFYVNAEGTEGLMVALEDASEGCPWGTNSNIAPLLEYPHNDVNALNDMSGAHNTGVLRNTQGVDSTYAAAVVDYANGWYLPSAGELRKLYSALPMIETSLIRAGGSTLTEDTYWSSTEYSTSDALTASFSMSNVSKTSLCRVRAIRKFLTVGAHTLVVKANNEALGTVSGSGDYENNETVTVSAEPNEGYVFQSWTEDGIVVSRDATWQFPFMRNRVLVANFIVDGAVGEIVHNADGSTGVVFYQNDESTEGWMVALEDASEGCPWGPESNIQVMHDYSCGSAIHTLEDLSGFSNTATLRNVFGTNNDYAASVVDFDNGWYLPSAGQLRKLYAALPMIEESIINAGGTLLTEDSYWSSTEYSISNACSPMFAMSNANKTSLLRVRAICNFDCNSVNSVKVRANDVAFGSVTGAGNYQLGATVHVTATPNPNYVFDHWEEEGSLLSYNSSFSFVFTHTRSLVAVFVREYSVGSIVQNDDGTRGIVFYTYPSGIGGLMVALEDASEGCPWGLNEDVTTMENQSPSVVMELLNDMFGRDNTERIRDWYGGNANYAACKPDFAHGWYLPSAGQLRKLYAALPLIEAAIVNAGGTPMTEDAYWSSTEQSESKAWTPSFAMSSSSKTDNCRVRAIRSLLYPETISANMNIEGGGIVTGAGVYDHGQTCTLKAQPNDTYAFLNWTCGGVVVSTNMEYSFTVLDSRTYTANFVANSYNITITYEPAIGGTVSGAGVYGIGEICTLSAMPNVGYSFKNWTKNGSQVSTNATYSFVVAQSDVYVAHFVVNSYAVTATASPAEGGIVSGAHAYNHGSTATLTATAAEGYTFVNWTENGAVVSTSPTLQFVVYGNRTLVANFSANAYTVTVIALPSDGGTIEGGGAYLYGTTATLTAHPNPQFEFFCWFEDDDMVSFNPTISFEVTEDVVLYAMFVEATVVLTKEINAYTANGGYYLLSVPLDEVNPEEVDHMLDNIYDLYKYDEAEELEWRNHKDNAFNLELGKGYLYANSEDVTLTFTGVPNSNNCTVTLKKTSDAETVGWNLVGNPFNQRAYLNRDFYVMNGYGSEIIAAQRNYIEPMEGVFVVANYNGESLTFTQAKSANDDKRIVINLSQGLGTTIIDRAIVRFGEGSGLPKFQINESSTKLFIQQDGKDYAVVCAKEQGEIPLNLKASEDGAYTLTVSGTLNSMLSTLNFSYLHLIDNLTGEDIDLLATPSYTFEAKTTDSVSRFVLVFRTSM